MRFPSPPKPKKPPFGKRVTPPADKYRSARPYAAGPIPIERLRLVTGTGGH